MNHTTSGHAPPNTAASAFCSDAAPSGERRGGPLSFTPEIRFHNLLVGLCRVIVSLEEAAAENTQAETIAGKRHSRHQRRITNTLRQVLSHNQRALRHYFGSAEPETVAQFEMKKDTLA